MSKLNEFLEQVTNSLNKGDFVKLTLSKPHDRQHELVNVYARVVVIKGQDLLSFTYHYKTKDETKNFSFVDVVPEITNIIKGNFKIATLLTKHVNLTYQVSKKGKESLFRNKVSSPKTIDNTHDRVKEKRVKSDALYLKLLGVSNAEGQVIPKMADKFRQINKYLEIIEGLIKSTALPDNIQIVDMGSGKGYLTFALYDYLNNQMNIPATVLGVEQRNELVDQCNDISKQCGFTNLKFVNKLINDFDSTKTDILIALHACDTATDDAIASGIHANASLIISAPCCHKQIRQQVKGKKQTNPLLQYGIFQERQFEMITDTIRALIMEEHHYQTKIFEFVSNEHTRKNIMMVGAKSTKKVDSETISAKIDGIKAEYGIEEHYLETLVKD